MGYESRLYFARKSNLSPMPEDNNHIFAIKEAVVNAGKLGGVPSCFVAGRTIDKKGRDVVKYKETQYFVYADDGDTPILEDKYGDPLYECTLEELWNWVVKKLTGLQPNTFYAHSLHLLKGVLLGYGSLDKDFNYKPNLFAQQMIVMHYGY